METFQVEERKKSRELDIFKIIYITVLLSTTRHNDDLSKIVSECASEHFSRTMEINPNTVHTFRLIKSYRFGSKFHR